MRRRRMLATVGTLAATSIAGCSAPATEGAGPEATTTTDASSLAQYGLPPTICETEPSDDPGIYAIDAPTTAADWRGVEVPDKYSGLDAESVVIGLDRDDSTRAYPLSIVWHHEVINDTLGGPVLVTFCPICRSAMVAVREVDGDPTIFEVTGQLWQPPETRSRASELDNGTFGIDTGNAEKVEIRNSGNLVLVDNATGSYWSQLLAQAICGPKEGERLEPVPAWVGRWGEWQATHPDTDVLLPPPHSGTV